MPEVAQGVEELARDLLEYADHLDNKTLDRRLFQRAAMVRRGAAELTRLSRELSEARRVLAYTDLGSLPNDWTLGQVAEARINDMLDLRSQVRDTCARAEKAEARLETIELAYRDNYSRAIEAEEERDRWKSLYEMAKANAVFGDREGR